jgi:hypothetical protein
MVSAALVAGQTGKITAFSAVPAAGCDETTRRRWRR